MSKKHEPIGEHWRLELPKHDLICCVADTLPQAAAHVASRFTDCEDLKTMEVSSTARALCYAKRSQGVVLLFTYDRLYTNLLCHEATHATAALARWMGVELTDASEEFYAYLTDLIYRLVLRWWQARKLRIQLLPPALNAPADAPIV